MPTLTTYGYKKPIDGETTWYTSHNDNITRLDAHSHNGVDSPIITKGTSTLLAASWSATSGQAGTYEQTVTIPTAYSMSTIFPVFLADNGADVGSQLFLSFVYVSATSFKVYVNDNTLQVKVLYA